MQRVRRQWELAGSGAVSDQVASFDTAELHARVQRLHELDDRFAHVGLSRYVMQAGRPFVPSRVRETCVATEV